MHDRSQLREPGPSLPRAVVQPIMDEDLPAVGAFLGAHFPPDTAAHDWADAWRQSVNLPGSGAPNHGFMLKADGQVVGAYPAIYSTRTIAGRSERFCNLAVWYVRPEYRLQSLALLRAVLAQPGFHFTDLTPIERVQALNLRLGFRYLGTDTALVLNLPWPTPPRSVRISADPAVISTIVQEPVRTLYLDHAACRWGRHLVVAREREWTYVQWRIERRKDLPLFASIQFASHPEVLRRSFHALARHFLLHHRAPFTLAELRVVGCRLQPSVLLHDHRRRMYRSDTLAPEQIDYLYSELTSAP